MNYDEEIERRGHPENFEKEVSPVYDLKINFEGFTSEEMVQQIREVADSIEDYGATSGDGWELKERI